MILLINHIFFWWYYKRVTPYYRTFTILRSIEALMEDYKETMDKLYPAGTVFPIKAIEPSKK
jgi:hypothetical protein